jgi:transposase-like protein
MGVSMAMGRPKSPLVLRPEQREQLEGMASSRSLPAGLVSRAKIILLSASGKTNLQIARQMGVTNATVGKWRRRFLEQDVTGLHDELRPGRPRPISDERAARLVRKTLETKPQDGTHWSIRQIAAETRVSKSTVHRCCTEHGEGQSADAMPAASPASGISGLPKRDRKERAGDVGQKLCVSRGHAYLENDKRERKATGSYYTPDHIVKYIVENTLGPILQEKFDAFRPKLREAQRRDPRQCAEGEVDRGPFLRDGALK